MKSFSTHSGLHQGQPVRLLAPTRGLDDDGHLRTFEPGAIGIIVDIQDFGAPENVGFTVVVEHQIVNTFDETNGPITSSIEAIELTAESLLDPDTYTGAAETHASQGDPDHEVGDLQQLFRVAFNMLSAEQKKAFLFHPDVRSVLASADIVDEPQS
jgi:hypothetical protein